MTHTPGQPILSDKWYSDDYNFKTMVTEFLIIYTKRKSQDDAEFNNLEKVVNLYQKQHNQLLTDKAA
jgi:hypothetical protein